MNQEKMKKKNYNSRLAVASIIASLFFFIPFSSFASTLFDTGTQPNGNSYAQFGTVIPGSYVTSTWLSNGFGVKLYNGAGATGTITGWFGYSTLAGGPGSSTITWLSSSTRNVSGSIDTSFTTWSNASWVAFTSTINYTIPYGSKFVAKTEINNGTTVSVNNNLSSGDILKCVGASYSCVSSTTLAIQVYGLQNSGGVSFSSPTNGQTVNDFSNWTLSATGLNPGEGYYFKVLYGQTTSTIGTYSDIGAGFTAADTVTTGNVGKSISLIPFSALATTTVSWSARPALYTSSSVIFGSDITFTVQRNAGFPSQPDWTASSVINYASSTLAGPGLVCPDFVFFASSTLSTIQCYVQKTAIGLVSFFFQPNPGTLSYAQGIITSFQNVFPFNLTLGTLNAVQSQVTQQSQVGRTLSFSLSADASHTATVDLFTANGLQDAIGSDAKLWFDNIVLMFMLVGFAYAIIKLSV